MNKKDNTFGFWAPIELQKGVTGSPNEMVLGGIASTIDEDADGEFLDPNGFDIQDFIDVGVVNWHHQAKDQPSTVIGEPTMAEIRPEGFYVETTLYPSSKVARDVWELAETFKKDSKTRRLGYSVEGQVVQRGSEDENHPAYNVVKKAKITGLAITHMPKNARTFAEIIKSFSSGAMGEETDESGPIDTKKKGKALMKESVDKKLKVLQKSYEIIDLDENSTIDKIFETFTDINIQKAENILIILNTMKNKKVSNSQIEKAMDVLGLPMDGSNPFLIEKAQTEENSDENTTETSAQKKIRESGVSHEELHQKMVEASTQEAEEAEEAEENSGDEIKKGQTNEIEKGQTNELEKSLEGDSFGKAAVKILSQRLEKAQKDNFEQNKALATLLKANASQFQKSLDANEELKSIIRDQNRVIKGLVDTMGTRPQPRKSITKGFTEKESFQAAQAQSAELQKGQNTLSMSKNFREVLNLVDTLSFSKGFDAEMSKATTSFESSKVLPQNIIARIQTEAGVTIID